MACTAITFSMMIADIKLMLKEKRPMEGFLIREEYFFSFLNMHYTITLN